MLEAWVSALTNACIAIGLLTLYLGYFARMEKRRWRRAIISGALGSYVGLSEGVLAYELALQFLSGLSAVPADYLTGLLAFDGIMIAVVTLTYSSRLGESSGKVQGIIALYISSWFIISALGCLYGLLRLGQEPGIGLGLSANSDSTVTSLMSSLNGIFVWLAWSVYFLLVRSNPKETIKP